MERVTRKTEFLRLPAARKKEGKGENEKRALPEQEFYRVRRRSHAESSYRRGGEGEEGEEAERLLFPWSRAQKLAVRARGFLLPLLLLPPGPLPPPRETIDKLCRAFARLFSFLRERATQTRPRRAAGRGNRPHDKSTEEQQQQDGL